MTPQNIHNMSIIESNDKIVSHALFKPLITKTPQKEIAVAMGVSLSAVEKHLQKAYRAVIEVQQGLDAEHTQPERLGSEGLDHVG